MLELKVPPPLVMIGCGFCMWLVDRYLPGWPGYLPGADLIAGALLLAGVAIAAAGILEFHRASTTVNPLSPSKTSSLVAKGVYRFTRNPMYLGMLLVLVALVVKLQNVAPALLLPVFLLYMTRFQILPEERALEAKFGSEFAAYRNRVRRWF